MLPLSLFSSLSGLQKRAITEGVRFFVFLWKEFRSSKNGTDPILFGAVLQHGAMKKKRIRYLLSKRTL